MKRTALLWCCSVLLPGLLAAGCCKKMPEDRNRPGTHAGPRGEDAAGDDDSAEVDEDVGFVDTPERRESVRGVVAPGLDPVTPVEGFYFGPGLEGELLGVEHWTLSLTGEFGLRIFANRMESEEIAKSLKRFYKSGRIPAGSPTEQLGFVGLLASPGDPLEVGGRELKRVDAQGYWQDTAVEGVVLEATCDDWPDDLFLAISAHAPKGNFDLAAAMPAIEALAVCDG